MESGRIDEKVVKENNEAVSGAIGPTRYWTERAGSYWILRPRGQKPTSVLWSSIFPALSEWHAQSRCSKTLWLNLRVNAVMTHARMKLVKVRREIEMIIYTIPLALPLHLKQLKCLKQQK